MPHATPGRSLVPQLNDPALPGHAAAATQVRQANGFSIRTDRFRYTEWDEGAELYDHRNDPDDWHNLARDPASQPITAYLHRLPRR